MLLLILIWTISVLIIWFIVLYKLFKITFTKEKKNEEENQTIDDWGDF